VAIQTLAKRLQRREEFYGAGDIGRERIVGRGCPEFAKRSIPRGHALRRQGSLGATLHIGRGRRRQRKRRYRRQYGQNFSQDLAPPRDMTGSIHAAIAAFRRLSGRFEPRQSSTSAAAALRDDREAGATSKACIGEGPTLIALAGTDRLVD